jgi:prepilin-type N-terminal cleavage/methylation domain-containing protein
MTRVPKRIQTCSAKGAYGALSADERAFTLIEVLIVVALIVSVYAVALPRINLKSGAEVSSKTGQLATDIRSAFDMAVLSGFTHRLVFEFGSGDYWLERCDRETVSMGDDALGHDMTAEEEKAAAEQFEDHFKEYESLAGEEVRDPDTGEAIRPPSPVVSAKSELKGATWTKVDTMEWKRRTLGPYLILKDMQAEHHRELQRLEDLGPKGRVMLYFLPGGQVERAVFHIAMRRGEAEADPNQPPYTVVTKSFEGMAEVMGGYQEVNVHED